MPVYEFRCPRCDATASVLTRTISDPQAPDCERCGSPTQRAISGFAFHQSLKSKLDQLDPKYDKMIDAANPDLASDRLVKDWGLDRPIPEDQKKGAREKLERFQE